ncbi:hypothetical protein POM88_052551 [Heracleum sosnowskyi]|uniref:Uncharacterized protein n=1 Tax=Heracleum sosnowskyi TaxID=360622 RepID=A0AAD8LY24_9APIA|nr:hypothetical protein POM88_052545 [Heracleum sosnowskyi]KAK1353416.1 hypothetical protein POM88_052551 [Heracleum sosnowskyi]
MSSPSHQFTINNCSTQYNFAVINITSLPARQNGSHAIVDIFGITVSVLLTALQLKYQARTDSPFQDHPKAMAISIASLLIFCLGCDVEQYLSTASSTSATRIHHVLRLFGFISLASLASVIFSTSTSPTSSFIVYLIFPWFFFARFVLHWIRYKNLRRSQGAYNFYNLRPHFAFRHYFNNIDTLPVYHVASANLV